MNDRFFTIHALNPAEDAEKLNAFLAANAVLSVERQFVGGGEDRTPTTLRCWANCWGSFLTPTYELLPADDLVWRAQCMKFGGNLDG